MFAFIVPYLGKVLVCWDCRRTLALRTMEKQFCFVPMDGGRLEYSCRKCGGEFTTTDAMSCTCPGRKQECVANKEALKKFYEYAELTLWKPKAEQRRNI